MHKIEMTAPVSFGETIIDEIEVKPLTFVELTKVWNEARNDPKPETALQRGRIKMQAKFKSKGNEHTPDNQQIRNLPLPIAKQIIAALDYEQGEAGELVEGTGDGTTSAMVYKLGTPIEMTSGKEAKVNITELEFFAKTYGEIEEVLASDNEMDRTVSLIQSIAKPIGIETLNTLPLWALDRLTVADGVTIMRKVSPAF